MRIGQVAEQLRVRPSTLRFYERTGILETIGTSRGSNNYRDYSPEDVDRLRLVLSLKGAGFRLEDVAKLLRPDASDCGTLVATAERQLKLVDRAIEELQKQKQVLEDLVGTCQTSCDPSSPLTSTESPGASQCLSAGENSRA